MATRPSSTVWSLRARIGEQRSRPQSLPRRYKFSSNAATIRSSRASEATTRHRCGWAGNSAGKSHPRWPLPSFASCDELRRRLGNQPDVGWARRPRHWDNGTAFIPPCPRGTAYGSIGGTNRVGKSLPSRKRGDGPEVDASLEHQWPPLPTLRGCELIEQGSRSDSGSYTLQFGNVPALGGFLHSLYACSIIALPAAMAVGQRDTADAPGAPGGATHGCIP